MTLLTDAVRKLEETATGTGCEDGEATLRRDPGVPRCQFERGADLLASFGGRTARAVTTAPIQTTTRLSSLFGRELPGPEERTAALGIVNAASGFLCLSRRLHACDPSCHGACMAELREEIGGRRIATPVQVPALSRELQQNLTEDPGRAGVILLTGEALIREEDGGPAGREGLLLLGPSTSGVAALLALPHWCPYGSLTPLPPKC
jgi:hypothetical protein